MPLHRIFRALGWTLPIVMGLAIACSDTSDSGGTRPSGTTGQTSSGSGTSGTGAGSTTTGSGTTSGSSTSVAGTSGTTGAGGASGTTTGGTTTGGTTTNASTTTGPGTTTGGTTTGTGGSGAGGAPPKDGGGPVVIIDAGKTGDTTCGAGVTPMGIGRCSNAPKYIVAKGTALTIANFEDPGPNNDHNTIFFGDGRAGNFINLNSGIGTYNMVVAQTAGTPNVNGAMSWAIHYSGTYTSGVMPMFAVPVADCYDSRAYKGVSFWIKGNPGAGNTQLKFQVHTPVAQPAPSGGCSAADAAAGKCDDHFAKLVPITSTWTRQIIKWTDLKQNCPSNIPAGYNPAQYNEMFSFAIPKPGAGFDVWLDDFTFDTGDLPTNTLGDIITEATFNEMWSLANADGTFTNLRNAFYTYQGMMSAIGGFPQISTTGTATTRRFEAAALFSNIAHETDSLGIVEEKACAGGMVQSTLCQGYGKAPNGLTYHGRGPIQLTLAANYSSANAALGLANTANDILQNPQIVATNSDISWRTGFWFWMGGLSGGGTTPHVAITNGQGLGATIRIINGIECGGANAAAVADRIRHYKRFCYMFGLDPGDATNGC
jgi:hypothetical protein